MDSSPNDVLQVTDSPSDYGEISLYQCLELCWASAPGPIHSPDSQLGPGTPGDCSFSLFFLTSLRPLPSPRISISGCLGCTEILPLPCFPGTKGKQLPTQTDVAFFFRTGLAPAAPSHGRGSGSIPCCSVNCLSDGWAPLGPKLGCPCSVVRISPLVPPLSSFLSSTHPLTPLHPYPATTRAN